MERRSALACRCSAAVPRMGDGVTATVVRWAGLQPALGVISIASFLLCLVGRS